MPTRARTRIPVTFMRERVSLPGERALCWALAAIFSSPTPWQYLSEHPACVDNLIHTYCSNVLAESDATAWQKKQRKRDLRRWMRFCPVGDTCPRRTPCARCEMSSWMSDGVLRVWLRRVGISSELRASYSYFTFCSPQGSTRRKAEVLADLNQASVRQVPRRRASARWRRGRTGSDRLPVLHGHVPPGSAGRGEMEAPHAVRTLVLRRLRRSAHRGGGGYGEAARVSRV